LLWLAPGPELLALVQMKRLRLAGKGNWEQSGMYCRRHSAILFLLNIPSRLANKNMNTSDTATAVRPSNDNKNPGRFGYDIRKFTLLQPLDFENDLFLFSDFEV
jgi:hypothetical protein